MKLMTITLSFSDGSVVLPMVVWTTQLPQIEGEGGSPPVQFHNTHAWMVGAGPLVSWSVAVVVRVVQFSLPPPPARVWDVPSVSLARACSVGSTSLLFLLLFWLHSQLYIWFSARPVTELTTLPLQDDSSLNSWKISAFHYEAFYYNHSLYDYFDNKTTPLSLFALSLQSCLYSAICSSV